MHCEFISGLEVTYSNALAAGGGFHRVTTAEGMTAEVSPHMYLQYKLSSPTPKTAYSKSDSDAESSRDHAAFYWQRTRGRAYQVGQVDRSNEWTLSMVSSDTI